MPLGRKHLRRSRDAPTGGNGLKKIRFHSSIARTEVKLTTRFDAGNPLFDLSGYEEITGLNSFAYRDDCPASRDGRAEAPDEVTEM